MHVAAAMAGEFADGAAFVPLAPLSDPDLVPSAIAQMLGIREGNQTAAASLAAFLHNRELLLVLDNFEHLLGAALVVAKLLESAPRLSILVTSRARLDLRAEHEFPVRPLAVPDVTAPPEMQALLGYDAVQLFLARARALSPDFALTAENAAAIVGVCARLDGLPLALELAAARITHLPPASLLARLDKRLPMLTGGPRDHPARLQTMRDAIAWSYDLLPARHQALFRNLSVFAGGFTLDAAERVSEAPSDPLRVLDDIAFLVAQSLVQHVGESGAAPRYTMLETMREYAWEQLVEGGDVEEVRRQHATHFLDLAQDSARRLDGAEMVHYLDLLSSELPNLRAALTWALEQGASETAARLAAALYPFWNFRGRLSEGRRWLHEAMAAGVIETTTRIDASLAIAGLAALQGDHATARTLGEESLRRSREQGYHFGVMRALFLLGITAEWRGDIELAASRYRDSLRLREHLGPSHWVARSLASLADAVYLQGHLDEAETLASEALALARETGHAWTEALALGVLAQVAVERAAYREAACLCAENLHVSQALGDQRGVAGVLGTLAGAFLAAGQPRHATRLLAAARALADSIGLAHLAHAISYDRNLARARASLSEHTFNDAWTKGLALPLDQLIADALRESALLTPGSEPERGSDDELTEREVEVLRLLAAGSTDREIGAMLFISHRTANAHVAHIFAKLDVHSRAEAAAEAVRRGLSPSAAADTPAPSSSISNLARSPTPSQRERPC
jgi:predicted ATPase/DNA-binding CsgD family transcriptional regulator